MRYLTLLAASLLSACELPTEPEDDGPHFEEGAPVVWAVIVPGGGNLFNFTCGLTVEGKAYCWGMNDSGQFGDGTRDPYPIPVPAAGGLTFAQLSLGWRGSCGLTSAGAAWCWGHGTLAGAAELVPTAVAGGHAFASLTWGSWMRCGLLASGAARCWGTNGPDRHLGDGSTQDQLAPVPAMVGHEFRSLASSHPMCGVTKSGSVVCWPTPGAGPTVGYPAGPAFVQLAVPSAGQPTCALTAAGEVWCSQLEVGLTQGPWRRRFEGLALKTITAGYGFVCGLTDAGSAWCWGDGERGALGHGRFEFSSVPVAVAGGHTFRSLVAGGDHVCGVTPDGVGWCWGKNMDGELGNGEVVCGNRGCPSAEPWGSSQPQRVRNPRK